MIVLLQGQKPSISHSFNTIYNKKMQQMQ